jgi:hypothetical protein
MDDPKPQADVAEQQRPALRTDLDANQRRLHDNLTEPLPEDDLPTETDPADVADQHRLARPPEDEPWP